MQHILQSLDGLATLVQAAAVAALSISAAVASLGLRKNTLQQRMERAAEVAVRATEQWRKVRKALGNGDPTPEVLKEYALDAALAQVPEGDVLALEQMIESAVQKLR